MAKQNEKGFETTNKRRARCEDMYEMTNKKSEYYQTEKSFKGRNLNEVITREDSDDEQPIAPRQANS